MKILAFVDMHGSMKALKEVMAKARKHNPDFIVSAGDVSIFEQNYERIMKALNSLGKPVLVVPGNHESSKRTREICSRLKNLIYMNKALLRIKGYIFIGIEADGFSTVDKEFSEWGQKIRKQIAPLMKKGSHKVILITHAPPYKTKLDNLMDSHCGNKDIRRFLEAGGIALAISGHIHENAGKIDKVKDAVLINPGPFGKIVCI